MTFETPDEDATTLLLPGTEPEDSPVPPSSQRPPVLQTQVLRPFPRARPTRRQPVTHAGLRHGATAHIHPRQGPDSEEATVVAPAAYLDLVAETDATVVAAFSEESCELTMSPGSSEESATLVPAVRPGDAEARNVPDRPPGVVHPAKSNEPGPSKTLPGLASPRARVAVLSAALLLAVTVALTRGASFSPRSAASPAPAPRQSQHEPQVADGKLDAPTQASPPEQPATQPPPSGNPAARGAAPTDPSVRLATDALFSGRRMEAQKHYTALAQSAEHEVYAVIARVLAEREIER